MWSLLVWPVYADRLRLVCEGEGKHFYGSQQQNQAYALILHTIFLVLVKVIKSNLLVNKRVAIERTHAHAEYTL